MMVALMPERRAEMSPAPLVSEEGQHSMLDLARDGWSALTIWRDRRRAAGMMRSLSDLQLRDLGVARVEIEQMMHGDFHPGQRPRRGVD